MRNKVIKYHQKITSPDDDRPGILVAMGHPGQKPDVEKRFYQNPDDEYPNLYKDRAMNYYNSLAI